MKLPLCGRPVAVAAAMLSAFALAAPRMALAQSTAMAPPISTGQDAGGVYNWQDVPAGQKVTIVRAVFDQGGYQLYDDNGDTIVIPFVNNNLYVMQFARSKTKTYFVNNNGVPTYHLPRGSYLTNSAASDARWYPFDKGYTYTQPVYIGPAPTWDAYVNMGWYPGMVYHGGYWSPSPWAVGVAYSPMPGIWINIGGARYTGWNNYVSYYNGHPANRVYLRNAVVYRHYGVHQHGSANFGHYHRAPGNHTAIVNHQPPHVVVRDSGQKNQPPHNMARMNQPQHDNQPHNDHPSGGHDHH